MKAGIIIPTLNEADHIVALLANVALISRDLVGAILVADGGSTDGTIELVNAFGARDPRVRLIFNPQKYQSAGVNLAVQALDDDIDVIIRMDAHSGYPDDFIPRLLRALSDTKASSVVVRLNTVGGNCVQNAISHASNGIVGTGGSDHRMGSQSRFVDHGHHAAFRRGTFEKIGGYDPEFRANEDAELDYRIRRSGGSIWFQADIIIDYVPRSTIRALFKQYWRYGMGRAQNILKHKERPRLRQMLPPILLLSLLASLPGSLISPYFLIIPIIYGLILIGASGFAAIKSAQLCACYLVIILPTMHLSWGGGFIARLLTGRYGNAAMQNRLC